MSNELVKTELTELTPNANSMFLDASKFEQMQRVAELFSKSTLVPESMQDISNCFIALHIADRMGEDPLMIMQNIYFVNKRPAWSTQYMIARANASGFFKGGITWDINKNPLSVVAKATLAATGEIVESPVVDISMAQAEGWTKNTKYKTMPEVMFRYRAAAMLIRLYAPQVMMGYHTVEEVETIKHQPADIVVEAKMLTEAQQDSLKPLIAKAMAVNDDFTQWFEKAYGSLAQAPKEGFDLIAAKAKGAIKAAQSKGE